MSILGQYPSDAVEGARKIVTALGGLAAGETVCIVSDPHTKAVGDLLSELATTHGGLARHFTIDALPVHGTEPPADVAAAMEGSALILGVTEKSMAHTRARMSACERGARYLSLPEYSVEMLQHPALRIDYKKTAEKARRAADVLTGARQIRITSPAGTDIRLDATGRIGNFCPGYVDDGHRLGSPPDIEANVSPVEEGSNGVAVIDGSIAYPGFGRLDEPVRLHVEGGMIRRMEGNKDVTQRLEAMFAKYGDKAKVLAEFGIGFNPEAKLCGNMLMDEGCYGTFHFGFGSNATVGGKNKVGFHLDFIFYASEFWADGERFAV